MAEENIPVRDREPPEVVNNSSFNCILGGHGKVEGIQAAEEEAVMDARRPGRAVRVFRPGGPVFGPPTENDLGLVPSTTIVMRLLS